MMTHRKAQREGAAAMERQRKNSTPDEPVVAGSVVASVLQEGLNSGARLAKPTLDLDHAHVAKLSKGGDNGSRKKDLGTIGVRRVAAETIIDPAKGPWWEQITVVRSDEIDQLQIGDTVYVDCGIIDRDPDQPRKNFKEEPLAELAEAIKADGQKAAGKAYLEKGKPGRLTILDGERRKLACQDAKVPYLVEIVPPQGSGLSRLADQITLNMGNEGHDHMEITLAIKTFKGAGKNVEWIARKFVMSTAWVYSYLAIIDLPPVVIEMMDSSLPDEKRLRFPVARQILKFAPPQRTEIAKKVCGLTMQAASIVIKRELGDDTPQDGTRKEKPSDRRGLFERLIDKMIKGLRGLESMSDNSFNRMFQHLPDDTCRAILVSMKRVVELTTGAQARILVAVPKLQTRYPRTDSIGSFLQFQESLGEVLEQFGRLVKIDEDTFCRMFSGDAEDDFDIGVLLLNQASAQVMQVIHNLELAFGVERTVDEDRDETVESALDILDRVLTSRAGNPTRVLKGKGPDAYEAMVARVNGVQARLDTFRKGVIKVKPPRM